ncbi:MAG: hypothetical protein LBT92_01825 [Rickettsiales bacterium]|jgi:hypothetical protein|nr:hypothetical protein [Rickettsiales bacterium]
MSAIGIGENGEEVEYYTRCLDPEKQCYHKRVVKLWDGGIATDDGLRQDFYSQVPVCTNRSAVSRHLPGEHFCSGR